MRNVALARPPKNDFDDWLGKRGTTSEARGAGPVAPGLLPRRMRMRRCRHRRYRKHHRYQSQRRSRSRHCRRRTRRCLRVRTLLPRLLLVLLQPRALAASLSRWVPRHSLRSSARAVSSAWTMLFAPAGWLQLRRPLRLRLQLRRPLRLRLQRPTRTTS